jgi:hypothetical protein
MFGPAVQTMKSSPPSPIAAHVAGEGADHASGEGSQAENAEDDLKVEG